MKIKLFSHVDLDGLGCGIVMSALFPEKEGHQVDITYCDYHKIDEKVFAFINDNKRMDPYDYIFITDISVNKDVAEKLQEIDERDDTPFVQLLDHHATAQWLNKYEWAYVNPQEYEDEKRKSSGTSLLLDFFKRQRPGFQREFSPRLLEFIETVRRYDTWEWSTFYNDVFPKEMNDLLYMVGKEAFISKILHCLQDEKNQEHLKRENFWFSEGDRMLLDQKQREIQEYIKKKNQQMRKYIWANAEGDDVPIGVVFAEQHISELGNELCKMHEDILFVMMIDAGEKKLSFRTVREDVHVGEIAKEYFGGGGHPKAAGAQIKEDNIYDFLDSLF